jgi:hypothetical protein
VTGCEFIYDQTAQTDLLVGDLMDAATSVLSFD